MGNKIYFFNATTSKLFYLSGKKAVNFLSKYPYWTDLSADDELIIEVSLYFEKNGKLIGNYKNALISYV